MLSGIILRSLTSTFLPQPVKHLVIDFLCTMEACAYFFENNFVLKYYGSLWFIIAIVLQCFVCARTFGEGSENPVKAMIQLLENRISPLRAVVQIAVQSLAGLASYRFAKMVWSLDLIADHHECHLFRIQYRSSSVFLIFFRDLTYFVEALRIEQTLKDFCMPQWKAKHHFDTFCVQDQAKQTKWTSHLFKEMS
ncbi:Aquaporin-11-like [Plakobranchus ocellatus]|uniref:Aquaporin-11-like n=1 Tax=Plakobranchus ocellatus TaxID=259542 RepID=A0AAV4B7R2_9GAST|nr:Aquaporin-11-like [Plakobranchus ocellatus]